MPYSPNQSQAQRWDSADLMLAIIVCAQLFAFLRSPPRHSWHRCSSWQVSYHSEPLFEIANQDLTKVDINESRSLCYRTDSPVRSRFCIFWDL